MKRDVDRRTTATDRLQVPPSPYVVQAGSVIPAALITGLRSDLPGQISAQVTSHVYDSPTGQFLLIPQGSRLLGEYDSSIAAGQRRLLLAWTRLIFPDGRSIVLEREPGTDQAGFAGVEDGVNNHWGRLFLAAGLATILNIGLETGEGDGDVIAEAIRDGTQDTIGRAGEAIVQRQLGIPPTLTVRPGFPVRVGDVKRAFSKAVGDAGLEGVTPHTLKHTAITWALQGGASIWDCAGFFSTSAETIERTYGHHATDYQESALKAVERR